ncbi:MAG: radical SAM protein [Nitrospirae bacterium]|nr:MAG: radical SAM protein [Nitrospirota bacterium]
MDAGQRRPAPHPAGGPRRGPPAPRGGRCGARRHRGGRTPRLRLVSEGTGLYLHLPFCASRCGYCTFVVTTDRGPLSRYLRALQAEMALSLPPEGTPLATLYLGGGTPSQVPPERLRALLEAVRARHPLAAGAEVTAEANPDDLSPGLLDAWAAAGVNRISLGVQSFVDRELAALSTGGTTPPPPAAPPPSPWATAPSASTST